MKNIRPGTAKPGSAWLMNTPRQTRLGAHYHVLEFHIEVHRRSTVLGPIEHDSRSPDSLGKIWVIIV